MITSVEVESPSLIRIRLAAPLKADVKHNISYGLPYSGQIGEITNIRKGSSIADHTTTEILIKGDLSEQLKPLIAEGAFNVSNMEASGEFTQAPIRHVYVDNGDTVLRFEKRELRDQVDFVVGQIITAQRPFTYGNLRDSDPEKALYPFSDKSYGKRAGKSYPLWNWCVLFKQFPISEK